jgi:hypothetical protein
MGKVTWLGICLLAVMVFTAPAKADYTFDFGIGVQKLEIEGDAVSELDGEENLALKIKFMLTPKNDTPWRFGFGLSGGYALDETDAFVFDGDAYTDDPFKELSILIPEFRVAYHWKVDKFWFVEPSIGVGPSIGIFRVGEDDDWAWGGGDAHWKVGIAVEPSIQIGWGKDGWALGAEASYTWTHLDFGDDAGGEIEMFYLGAFFRYAF